MLRGPQLRAAKNKKMVFNCENKLSMDKTCIVLPEFNASTPDGTERVILKEGDSVKLVGVGNFRMIDRVAMLRLHPEFYKSGMVFGMDKVVPNDGEYVAEFTFVATKRVNLNKIPYFLELYLGE